MGQVKILITGAEGFIGKNLCAELEAEKTIKLYKVGRKTSKRDFLLACKNADIVFHLAGVNRPDDESDFNRENVGFTQMLIDELEKENSSACVFFSSSIQADQDNPYGRSKLEAEEILKKSNLKVFNYRLTNVFGKWSRPHYNSVVATFCHNVAHNKAITVHDSDALLTLTYIDDVIEEFKLTLSEHAKKSSGEYAIETTHAITLAKLAGIIQGFPRLRLSREIPDFTNALEKKLYSTYLSYLPKDKFKYPLEMNKDQRGSFTEFIRSESKGQVSVNVSEPGVTKGEHWHHTKTEKFLVISGEALISLRHYFGDEIIEYSVSDEKFEVVDIPPGYTHNIINTGSTKLVTMMWSNECFDPEKPDTYFLKV